MEEVYGKVKNFENLETMQEQAIKRAQQIHQKAKDSMNFNEYGNFVINPENVNFRENEEPPKIKNEVERLKNSGPKVNGLDFLLKDSERSLILVLLLLLCEEKCDMGLILALMYLLL